MQTLRVLVAALLAACGTRSGLAAERDSGSSDSGSVNDAGTGPREDAAVAPRGCARADDVAVGSYHSCAAAGGDVWCWGFNQHGELGVGDRVQRDSPAAVVGLHGVRSLVAGMAHTCVLHDDQQVSCWGWNRDGQVGNGSGGTGAEDPSDGRCDVLSPSRVEGLDRVQELAATGTTTCALIDDGTVRCWGAPYFGGIGDGGDSDGRRPAMVIGLSDVVQIAGAGCARTSTAQVWCWGMNVQGEVGDGTTTNRFVPVRIEAAEPSRSVGRIYEGCSLDAEGRARCWGGGRLSPVLIPGLAVAERLVVGVGMACTWNAASEASCWGGNFYGTLGDGTTEDKAEPARMPHWDQAAELASSGFHTCAIVEHGDLVCTGYGAAGALGDGTTHDHHEPACVSPLE